MRTLLIRTILTAIVLSGAVAVVMVFRTVTLSHDPLPEGDALPFVLGEPVALERFAESLRFVADPDGGPGGTESSGTPGLHRHLEEAFPALHRTLERSWDEEGRLRYTWWGSDPEAAPFTLQSRLDVEGVAASAASAWRHPPFSGAIADGYVWGRGAQGPKAAAIATLEAVEGLVEAGFTPRATLVLALGPLHRDEAWEGIPGPSPAPRIDVDPGSGLDPAPTRASPGPPDPAWVLRAEPGLVSGGVPGVRDPVGVVGTAGTGSIVLELEGETRGLFERAVRLLEEELAAPRMRGPVRDFYTTLAPRMDPGTRMLMANLWLLERPVSRALAHNAFARPSLGTGLDEVRMSPGGEGRSGEVRLRLVPGDEPDAVLEGVRTLLDRRGVEVRVSAAPESVRLPSRVSSRTGPGFTLVRDAIHRVFPDVIAVAPALVADGDAGVWTGSPGADVYRFAPLRVELTQGPHPPEVDERIAIPAYLAAVRFYAELIARASDPD